MFRNSILEFWVGLFLLFGIAGLVILAFKVSGLSGYIGEKTYTVYAAFDNVGGLKVRSQVAMAGVRIGEVTAVDLDEKTFRARVTMKIDNNFDEIPTDSSASIFTEGLLGANYISISPGFDESYLKEGGKMVETHSALILENLIGQFLYSANSKKDDEADNSAKSNKSDKSESTVTK